MAALGASVTLAVVFVPAIRFAYRNPSLHVAIDTADAVIALLVSFLLFGRFARTHLLRDLLLVFALLLFGLGNLFLSAIPSTVTGVRAGDLSTWGVLVTRTMAAGFMTAAAFTGRRKISVPRRISVSVVLISALIVTLVGLVITRLGSSLPPAVAQSLPADATRPVLEGHELVLVLQAVVMAMFVAVAFKFTFFAERDNDELMRWFGAGAALAAFARLNYLLYPSLYSNYVYTGDAFRLGFYLTLLIGAGREIASYWEGFARTAVAEERRRIARDLHDGLAQELAFLWADMRALGRDRPDDERIHRATAAAERALDESRRAISAFTRPPNEPLDVAITGFIEEVARRLDARLRLDLAPDIELPAKPREDLLRVVREAVTNAVRHGHAETITVRLWKDDAVRLKISDDGVGFDPDQPQRNGSFGIVSMRERVTNHGGRLQISSSPGQGTEVEVVLP